MKKQNRNSPFGDTSLFELEQSLANALPNGAAGYHQGRTMNLWGFVTNLALLIVMVSLIAFACGNPDTQVSKTTAGLAVITLLVALCTSVYLQVASKAYRGVRREIKEIRSALSAAEKENMFHAIGGWGHNLEELLEVLNGTAKDLASERDPFEKSIRPADQRRSVRLKKLLSRVMTAGRLVEVECRKKQSPKLDRWDSPVIWPGEKGQRGYPTGSLRGEPAKWAGVTFPVRVPA